MNVSTLKPISRLFIILLIGWLLMGCATKSLQQKSLEFNSDSYLLPLLTDYSSLQDHVVKKQKLFDRQAELNRSRFIYSYVLIQKNCQLEEDNKKSLAAMQRLIERQMESGIARQSEYLLAKADLLAADVRESQCNTQLDVLNSYAKFIDITPQTIDWKYTPLGEALSLQTLKNSFSAQPLLWEHLEWPLTKLIHSVNGKSNMDKALSTQLIVHTKLALTLEQQFQVGLISIKDFINARQEAFELEKKLNENRMAMVMALAELKYLLAKPLKPM